MRQSIERITCPDQNAVRYLESLRPVVVTNCFDGEPIRAIRTRTDALAQWGSVIIPIADSYDESVPLVAVQRELRRHSNAGDAVDDKTPPCLTISEYYNRVDAAHYQWRPRVAFEVPEPLESSFRVPEICLPRPTDSVDLRRYCFIGCRRSFSQTHYDKDGMHGLLYQIFGRKHVVVFPARSARRLLPLAQFGSWFIHNLTPDDRNAFLTFAEGQEVVLEAGDCVYLPAFCWHYTYCMDDSWSLNIRFRRSRRVTALLNVAFPDVYMQALGTALAAPDGVYGQHAAIMQELECLRNGAVPRSPESVQSLRRRARAICHRLLNDPPPDEYARDLEGFLPPLLPAFMSDATCPQYG